MDFGSAALLVVAVYALVEFAKAVLPGSWRIESAGRQWLKVLTALLAGQVAVWGLGATVWANEQVISGHKLTDLNAGSKVAAGLFLAALAAGLQRGLDAVKNVGENQPSAEPAGGVPKR